MAERLSPLTEGILLDRFGQECIMALATAADNRPAVRNVTTYYRDGCFYLITYTPSEKMNAIRLNPAVALAGKWFSGQGVAEDLGYAYSPANRPFTQPLEAGLAAWWTGGDTDERLCLLRIRMENATIYDHDIGAKYEVDFSL